jgi:hypothetical protein
MPFPVSAGSVDLADDRRFQAGPGILNALVQTEEFQHRRPLKQSARFTTNSFPANAWTNVYNIIVSDA